jgi:hypothetical protein
VDTLDIRCRSARSEQSGVSPKNIQDISIFRWTPRARRNALRSEPASVLCCGDDTSAEFLVATVGKKSEMPAFFKIDKERRPVMSTGSGVLTMAEAMAHQDNLRKHPDFDPSFSQLVDLSNVTKIELSHGDMERFAQAAIFSPNSRRAFLVAGDAVYGLARMFAILRDNAGEKGIQVFRDLDAALDWVLAKPPPR